MNPPISPSEGDSSNPTSPVVPKAAAPPTNVFEEKSDGGTSNRDKGAAKASEPEKGTGFDQKGDEDNKAVPSIKSPVVEEKKSTTDSSTNKSSPDPGVSDPAVNEQAKPEETKKKGSNEGSKRKEPGRNTLMQVLQGAPQPLPGPPKPGKNF